MTTLTDRPATVLLVIDVQTAVVADALRRDEVVARIDALIARARDAAVPVIWVQHSHERMPVGGDAWQIVAELAPAVGEPVVHKRYGDAFEATELETLLADRHAGHLVITGAATDQCILSTLFGAQARGYDTTLVSDAHTTSDLTALGAPPPEGVVAHLNLVWAHTRAPGRCAAAVPADEVRFEAPVPAV